MTLPTSSTIHIYSQWSHLVLITYFKKLHQLLNVWNKIQSPCENHWFSSHLFLKPSSCHSLHTFLGIPTGLKTFIGIPTGLKTRIRKIRSDDIFFKEKSRILKGHLCNRSYKAYKVKSAIDQIVMKRQENPFALQRGNIQRQGSTCHLLPPHP